MSIGTDLAWQGLDEFKHPNLGNAVEEPELLSEQIMSQMGTGVFLLDCIEFSPEWSATMSLRYDRVSNRLDDHLKVDGIDLSGKVSFGKLTSRIGIAWKPLFNFGLYASWGTGFLPPGTEELVNNPYALGGYNAHIFIGPLKEEGWPYVKTITFLANPDQLSTLMIGAQYHSAPEDLPPVIAPFGSGCRELIPFKDFNTPQASIGASDIAMRQHLPPDILAFTVTKPMLVRLCKLDGRSFLYKTFLRRLKEARGATLFRDSTRSSSR